MAGERILVLNGPNLNLLGRREPAIYGTDTLADVRDSLESLAAELSCTCDVRQTNYEGRLVDWLHEAWETADGVILNPAGLTHQSYPVRDAVAAIGPPVVELHISNIHARESFRSRSGDHRGRGRDDLRSWDRGVRARTAWARRSVTSPPGRLTGVGRGPPSRRWPSLSSQLVVPFVVPF